MVLVLVIDDDAKVRRICRLLLERAGFEVAEASDGETGLRAFRKRPADVVLCDLFMPGSDGLELIRGLHCEFPGVRVVAMSGGALVGTCDMLPVAQLIGAVEVLHKPFEKTAVLAAIKRALESVAAS
jgi:DNA-binding NtrC family response regulator